LLKPLQQLLLDKFLWRRLLVLDKLSGGLGFLLLSCAHEDVDFSRFTDAIELPQQYLAEKSRNACQKDHLIPKEGHDATVPFVPIPLGFV